MSVQPAKPWATESAKGSSSSQDLDFHQLRRNTQKISVRTLTNCSTPSIPVHLDHHRLSVSPWKCHQNIGRCLLKCTDISRSWNPWTEYHYLARMGGCRTSTLSDYSSADWAIKPGLHACRNCRTISCDGHGDRHVPRSCDLFHIVQELNGWTFVRGGTHRTTSPIAARSWRP